jgi:very-short-patch-repair endonuclease
MRKETSPFFQRHSDRMAEHNPATDYATMARMSAGRARYLGENPTKREQYLLTLLSPQRIPGLRFQYPVGIYIFDFAWPVYRVGLEIDGTTHSRAERITHDTIRTDTLIREGWTIVRHAMTFYAKHPKGLCLYRLGSILQTLIPNLQLIYPEPPAIRSQYRVFISSPEYPSGIRVKSSDDPRLDILRHRFSHTTPTPTMSHDTHADVNILDSDPTI